MPLLTQKSMLCGKHIGNSEPEGDLEELKSKFEELLGFSSPIILPIYSFLFICER